MKPITHNDLSLLDLQRGKVKVRFRWKATSNIVDVEIIDSSTMPPNDLQVFHKKHARTYWQQLIAKGYKVRAPVGYHSDEG